MSSGQFAGLAVIASGLLPATYTNGQHAQNVTGAKAVRTATAGKWNIDLNGKVFDVRIHTLIAVPAPGVTITAAAALFIVPGLQGDGVSVAMQEGVAGVYAAADKAMSFVIV